MKFTCKILCSARLQSKMAGEKDKKLVLGVLPYLLALITAFQHQFAIIYNLYTISLFSLFWARLVTIKLILIFLRIIQHIPPCLYTARTKTRKFSSFRCLFTLQLGPVFLKQYCTPTLHTGIFVFIVWQGNSKLSAFSR